MKEKKFDYYEAVLRKADNIFLMPLPDFARYAVASHIRQIMLTSDGETDEACFAFSSNGAVYLSPSQGFQSLEDVLTSRENHFPDAAVFYEALKNNCSTFAEYQMVLTTGVADPELIE